MAMPKNTFKEFDFSTIYIPPYTPISPSNSAIVFDIGTYRKGADLIITHVLLFSVSPNTVTKRTEENNRQGQNSLPSMLIYENSKRGILHLCSLVILKFGDFRIKN